MIHYLFHNSLSPLQVLDRIKTALTLPQILILSSHLDLDLSNVLFHIRHNGPSYRRKSHAQV